MVNLESNALLIVTESGGVQKEAYFHSVPCITPRTETEWTETVKTNWNTLADPGDAKNLKHVFDNVVNNLDTPEQKIGDYGSGKASEIISQKIHEYLFNK